MNSVQIGDVVIGGGSRAFALIAGPCVIESETHAQAMAGAIAEIARRVNVPYIFKASFDKANRTSGKSFRGPGLAEGLRVLASIKAKFGVPILTDIHEASQAAAVSGIRLNAASAVAVTNMRFIASLLEGERETICAP